MRKLGSGLKCFVAGMTMYGVMIALPNAAQQAAATQKESFDVLSIKQVYSHSQGAGGTTFTSAPRTIPCQYEPDRVRCQRMLRYLIEDAYQITDIELDAPTWTNDKDHWFAIEGTMPPGTSKETARLMLRQGLIERFGLQVHWEKRDTPVYALVAGKNGVSLQPVSDPDHPKLKPFTTAAGEKTTGMNIIHRPGEFFAAAITMDGLAEQIWSRAGLERPVVNMTGLTGVYDIDLHWTPPESPSIVDPAILSVVEKKLGLRLEKRTLPFNVLVVDHVEKAPTAN
jgi:uncharacterized protein (TIGR03435 family)